MKKPFFHILLIVTVGLLAYSNTFSVPFHFDDPGNIAENPIIKDLSYFADPASAAGFQLYNAFKSRFIGYLSFALNYQLHGLNVAGYHIVNLAIHIINALLVYWLVILTFSAPYFASRQNSAHLPDDRSRPANLIALFSALLFVSHPIQTQAVTYIVQRFASLATLFYLLSLVSYVKGRHLGFPTPNVKPVLWYLASLISAALAMKTKEIAFTLPVVIALYEFMFFEGMIKKRVLWLIPLLLTMLIIPLSLIAVDKPLGDIIGDVSEATRLETTMSRWDYLFTQCRVIITYIRLLFLPINQNLDYDYPVYNTFFNPSVFLSFIFLFAIFCIALYLFYRSKHTETKNKYSLRFISFGILWFFITLSVESSIIPITDVIFEHRIYLPSIGFLIALIECVRVIKNKLMHNILSERTVALSLAFIVIIYSGASHHRNAIWQDKVTLWQDVVSKSPLKARSRNNLGLAYQKQGHYEDAIREYQAAIKLKPDFAEAHDNLGLTYEEQGRYEDAIREYQIAIELKPGFDTAHNDLGVVYEKLRRYEDAIREYQIAIKLNPGNDTARHNLDLVYKKLRLYVPGKSQPPVASP